MKNKCFTLTTALITLTVVLSACGGSNDISSGTEDAVEESTVTEKVDEPLDLTGLWVQENADKSYMVADIKDDSIGVFFILEGDDTPWTYWVGTYTAPTDDKNTYDWTSESTYGGNGMLASSEDEKDFSYENGKLQCKVSIQGTTDDPKVKVKLM